MPRNQIVINVDIGETRVALIENGIVTELLIERRGERSNVGDVYLGRVTRVLPGMNAAFVDIGLERAAFLHSEDVVAEQRLRETTVFSDDDDSAGLPPQKSDPVADSNDNELLASGDSDGAEGVDAAVDGDSDGDEGGEGFGDPDALDEDGEGFAARSHEGGSHEHSHDDGPIDDEVGVSDLLADAGGELPAAPQGNGNHGNHGNHGNGNHGGHGQRKLPKSQRQKRKEARRRGGGSGGGGGRPQRKEKPVRSPIRDLLREGQEIVVQVSKDPIGTKGARCTSHISLAGRYSVYLPTVEHVGVSKRIGSERERRRLREVIEQLKPEKGGIIVRTASEGLTKKGLKTDVAYLVTLWNDIWRKREQARGATLLFSELDVVLRTVRDVMGPEIEKVIIDDREAHARCARFVERFMPERKDDIVLYQGDEPLFDAYGIEDEIARALARKVPLPSGGYLIIDQAEALTAIDVNSGRFVGQKDVEETVTQTNLEAVDEIAYQLRLRNLGGLVILDLIDMERQGNRDKVYKALAEALAKDKAKTSILRISELGLIEMTRKRTRESLGRQLYEPCFYCDGTGHTSSRLTIAYEVLRQIRRERDQLKGYTIVVHAHPAVADALKHEAKEAFEEAQRRYQRRIVVMSKPEYHIEQFDLSGQ
ncbi:MAG: Rne/Rng family ribonuclease [Myxococcales bacterium]|nr:Rne/Rng family ribonuclease [Myxococcales bacterium]